jgi:hypothetical protein
VNRFLWFFFLKFFLNIKQRMTYRAIATSVLSLPLFFSTLSLDTHMQVHGHKRLDLGLRYLSSWKLVGLNFCFCFFF